MLSYQHGFHAGNRADCLKHAVLHAVLQETAATGRPVLYVETHAARGLYDLTGEQARKTNEAKLGVLSLPSENKAPKALKPWLSDIQGGLPETYPGSPLLASRILGDDARLVFFELHPAEYAALQKTIGPDDDRVLLRKEDGYRAALRLQPRRGEDMLVFLDPSYETEKDMEALADWVPRALRKWPRAKVLIWLPLFADGREDEFGAYLASLDKGFVAGTRWPHGPEDDSALAGSAMIGLRVDGNAAKRAFAIAAQFDALWRGTD